MKKLFVLSFTLLTIQQAFSQNPRLTIQNGHSAAISSIDLTNNRRLLLTSQSSPPSPGQIILWDYNLCKQLLGVALSSSDSIFIEARFSADDKSIITIVGERIDSIKLMLGLSKKPRFNILEVRDLETLRVVRKFKVRILNPKSRLRLSSDGTFLIYAGNRIDLITNLISKYDNSKLNELNFLTKRSGISFKLIHDQDANEPESRVVEIYDSSIQKSIIFEGKFNEIRTVNLSVNNKYLAVGVFGSQLFLDPSKGAPIYFKDLPRNYPYYISSDIRFTNSDKHWVERIASNSREEDYSQYLYESKSGTSLFLSDSTNDYKLLNISEDGEMAILDFQNESAVLMNGAGLIRLDIKSEDGQGFKNWEFSLNNKHIYFFTWNNSDSLTTYKISSETGRIEMKLITPLSHTWLKPAISPDGTTMFDGDRLVDLRDGHVIFTVPSFGIPELDTKHLFHMDWGRRRAIISYTYRTHVWDYVNGKMLFDLPTGEIISREQLIFSSDGKYLVSQGLEVESFSVWNLETGRKIFMPKGKSRMQQLSNDGSGILAISGNSTITIYETTTGQIASEFMFDRNLRFNRLTFGSDEDKVYASSLNQLFLFDLKEKKEIVSLLLLDSVNFIHLHQSGLFDASPGAMEKLYFVQGLDIIDFNQLKERYYEPGLWKKVMSGEKLRNVVGFKSIDLPPDIRVGQVDQKGYLPIELINRGGGIGEVAVYIRGKEVTKDARDNKANSDLPSLKINYYVGNHKNLANGENLIAVKAWDKDHWVESRGTVISYTKGEVEKKYQPIVHILTCGISDYAGGIDIDLTYAAKDAEDVSKALRLGASKLFGTQKSYTYNLTTSQPKEFWPTKTNILKTFEKISSTAHPLDIIVVYLSGHGINIGGTEGDWHYLTQEAYTPSASAYSDPAIRKQTTISSNELVELFKTIPAAKQVLIIDACASGKVVDNLIVKKDVPSSTLRALDRMCINTNVVAHCRTDQEKVI